MPAKNRPLAGMGHPGYHVTRGGQIIGQHGRPLKPAVHPQTGRLTIELRDWKNKRVRHVVARLVLEAFGKPSSKGAGYEAEHVNGDLTDCALKNLRWRKKGSPGRDRMLLVVRGIVAKNGFTVREVFPEEP